MFSNLLDNNYIGILQVNDIATPVVSNTFDRSGELIAGVASVGGCCKISTAPYVLLHKRRLVLFMNTAFLPLFPMGRKNFSLLAGYIAFVLKSPVRLF
jgi:hypothetical protein